jgi:hypothetical protein
MFPMFLSTVLTGGDDNDDLGTPWTMPPFEEKSLKGEMSD